MKQIETDSPKILSTPELSLSPFFEKYAPTIKDPRYSASRYYEVGVLLHQLDYINQINQKVENKDIACGYLPILARTAKGKFLKINKLGVIPDTNKPCLYDDKTVSDKAIIYSDTIMRELLFAGCGFSINNGKNEFFNYKNSDLIWVFCQDTSKSYLVQSVEIRKIPKNYYKDTKFKHHIVLNLYAHSISETIILGI